MTQIKITRRELAVALGASAAANAQVTPTGRPAEDLLVEVAGELRKAAARLEEFKLPAEAEPAFVFKP